MNSSNIIVILALLLGVSVYFNVQGSKKKDLIFENNLRCAQYIEQENEEADRIADLPINQTRIVSVPKVFYSPVLNTCVSALRIDDFREGFSSYYVIKDLLINESILEVNGLRNEISGQIASDQYHAKLEELSGR